MNLNKPGESCLAYSSHTPPPHVVAKGHMLSNLISKAKLPLLLSDNAQRVILPGLLTTHPHPVYRLRATIVRNLARKARLQLLLSDNAQRGILPGLLIAHTSTPCSGKGPHVKQPDKQGKITIAAFRQCTKSYLARLTQRTPHPVYWLRATIVSNLARKARLPLLLRW